MDRTEPDQGRSEPFIELGLIREALWKRHLAGLPADLRAMLENGTHPSFSWDCTDEAIPYLDALRQQLASVDYVARVSLGYYHGDSLIITVDV